MCDYHRRKRERERSRQRQNVQNPNDELIAKRDAEDYTPTKHRQKL